MATTATAVAAAAAVVVLVTFLSLLLSLLSKLSLSLSLLMPSLPLSFSSVSLMTLLIRPPDCHRALWPALVYGVCINSKCFASRAETATAPNTSGRCTDNVQIALAFPKKCTIETRRRTIADPRPNLVIVTHTLVGPFRSLSYSTPSYQRTAPPPHLTIRACLPAYLPVCRPACMSILSERVAAAGVTVLPPPMDRRRLANDGWTIPGKRGRECNTGQPGNRSPD